MKNIKLTYENNYKKVYESEGVNKKGEKIIFDEIIKRWEAAK